MNASDSSDAQKAFRIKQGEDGTPVAMISSSVNLLRFITGPFDWARA